LELIDNLYTSSFHDESPELKKLIKTHGVLQTLSKGDFIIQENTPSSGFYWIVEGAAKVTIQSNKKNEQIVTLLSQGEFVGISAVMNDHEHTKSAQILSSIARVLFIKKEDFLTFMHQYPMVVIPLMKHIESKIDKIENRAAQIMRKNIEQRLAYVYLMLQNKFGCDENGFIRFNLSPKDMANFVGTTRTTVYRVLRKFQDAKLLNQDHKRIQILTREGLQQIFNSQLELA
jgi:CRP-like cAMP-binding protein